MRKKLLHQVAVRHSRRVIHSIPPATLNGGGRAAVIAAMCLILQNRALCGATDVPDYNAPKPGSYALPVIKLAADGSVVDSAGKSVQLSELTRGKVTVLSFIYTRCAAPGACPYATGVLNELHELSAKYSLLGKELRLVSMSFDPDHDTPARLASYAQIAEGRPESAEWRFVTAPSRTALQPILEAYDQAVDSKANPSDLQGPLNHTLRVYLVDAVGQIRNIYSSGTLDVRLVLADIRTLLMENQFAKR